MDRPLSEQATCAFFHECPDLKAMRLVKKQFSLLEVMIARGGLEAAYGLMKARILELRDCADAWKKVDSSLAHLLNGHLQSRSCHLVEVIEQSGHYLVKYKCLLRPDGPQ